MSITRSPSRQAKATEFLIVAYGSPSGPKPQEHFARRPTVRVMAQTGAMVRKATLVKNGSLEAAVGKHTEPQVFPHFMADGWFVSTNMQSRLAKTELKSWTTPPPLELNETLPILAHRRIKAKMEAGGLPANETTLVTAAHGSPSDRRLARSRATFAEALKSMGLVGHGRMDYVDGEPSLQEVDSVKGAALVLPFLPREPVMY